MYCYVKNWNWNVDVASPSATNLEETMPSQDYVTDRMKNYVNRAIFILFLE